MKKYQNIALNNQYIILGLQKLECPYCHQLMMKKEYPQDYVIELFCIDCIFTISNCWIENILYHAKAEMYLNIKSLSIFQQYDNSIMLIYNNDIECENILIDLENLHFHLQKIELLQFYL
jgi:hypothetical protein